MKLQEALSGASALSDLERYVNAGTRTYSAIAAVNEVCPRFQPASREPCFLLPEFAVPRDRVRVFEDAPPASLRSRYVGEAECWFPIHPEILNDPGVPYLSDIEAQPSRRALCVSPMASTRTVYVFRESNVPAHYLKLHLPRQISRFYRFMRYVTVEFCVAISEDLRNLAHEQFAYLPESLAMAVGDRANGWGLVVRESEPRPKAKNPRGYIPFFALYGKDVRRPTDPPLLAQLIDACGADPVEYACTHLIEPLIATWCHAVRQRGIVFSAHAENVLLEIDAELQPTRIVHRDLDVEVDPLIRGRRGIHTDFHKNRIDIDLEASRAAVYSLEYDSFMGHHLFDYLARTLHRVYACDPEALRSVARDSFHRSFPESDEFFPETVHYYENRVGRGNQVPLIDTGKKPTWR
jgi:hypothetical protein